MKLAQIETSAEFPLGALAKFFDLQFPGFVSQRLPGPGNVAIDFVDDVEFLFGRSFP